MANKTTLWYVSLAWEAGNPLVFVSERPLIRGYELPYMRIRTISWRAAGRKFVRNNLISIIAKADMEVYNPFSRYGVEDLTPKRPNKYRREQKAASIRRVKGD